MGRMGRAFVRSLVLLLVPAVVVAGASLPADAEISSGDPVEFSVGDITFNGTGGWECGVAAYFVMGEDGITTAIWGEADCRTGSLADDTYVESITAESGAGSCSWTQTLGVNIDESDERDFGFTLVGSQFYEHDCTPVTSICFEVRTTGKIVGADTIVDECVAVALPNPPAPAVDDIGDECPFGRPGQGVYEWHPPVKTAVSQSGNFITYRMVQTVRFKVRQPTTGGVAASTDWWFYATFRGDNPTISFGGGTGSGTASTVLAGQTIRGAYSPMQTAPLIDYEMRFYVSSAMTENVETGATAGNLTITSEFHGAGVALGRGGTNPTITASPGVTVPVEPREYLGKAMGWHDPGACVWYRGQKVVESASVTTDDPVAAPPAGEPAPPGNPGHPDIDPPAPDTDEPPEGTDPEDEGCGEFSLWDPTTWAGAGICVLVKAILKLLEVMGNMLQLLGDLIAAVVGLVAALLEGLLDLLMALFVPDGDALADHIAGLRDVFDTSPAGGWSDAVEQGIGGSVSGGCDGPTVSMPTISGQDLPDVSPFSACGDLAQPASLVRGVLSVMIGLGGGFLMLRMVLSSLGIRTAAPSLGEGKS